jgi:hypothetical protein
MKRSMRNLKTFENFEPIDSEVSEIEKWLSDRYQINWYNILDKKVKGIFVDDKIYYISGGFSSKKYLVGKIYLEVVDELSEWGRDYSESSIRKAIKNFLNS